MAKIDLKFLSVDNTHTDTDCDWIKTRASSIDCDGVYDEVCVEMKEGENINTIYLDVSTAIKFAKTLRTEINKIKGI